MMSLYKNNSLWGNFFRLEPRAAPFITVNIKVKHTHTHKYRTPCLIFRGICVYCLRNSWTAVNGFRCVTRPGGHVHAGNLNETFPICPLKFSEGRILNIKPDMIITLKIFAFRWLCTAFHGKRNEWHEVLNWCTQKIDFPPLSCHLPPKLQKTKANDPLPPENIGCDKVFKMKILRFSFLASFDSKLILWPAEGQAVGDWCHTHQL